jgi:valyl-tRNA synthetase
MSKSKGNVLDPLELIDEYGADAVRFTLTAMAAVGRDLKLSTNRIAGYRNFGTKIWNVARFAEMNGCLPTEDFKPEDVTQTLNIWMVGKTVRFKVKMDDALSSYRFNDAANCAYSHVWGTFCDWYVELSKPLFQMKDGNIKEETKKTMAWALDQCLIILHPIMPFITEELWGKITSRKKMLIHADWPTYKLENFQDQNSDREIEWVINLIEQIRSIRSELGVPPAAKVPLHQVVLDPLGKEALRRNKFLIERLARLSGIEGPQQARKGSVTIVVEGGEFALEIINFIDLTAEKERLKKSIDKVQKEMDSLKNKIENKKFIANAPAQVIAETGERLSDLNEELLKLSAAKQRLENAG